MGSVNTLLRSYVPTLRRSDALTFLTFLTLSALSLVLRLPLRVPWLESWDEVDFALGLARYSLSEYRPHFPGYPVYLWMSHSLLPWTGSETALNLVSAFLGGLTPLPFFLLVRDLYSRKTAWLASLLLILNPLHWLLSERALSDVPGSFFVIAFLCLSSRVLKAERRASRRILTAGAFAALALALGARPSYFPFLITAVGYQIWVLKGLAARKEKWEQVALATTVFLTVCSLWLLWQAIQLRGESLWSEGTAFVGGHFSRWGGTALAEPNLLRRAGNLFKSLCVHGLGFYGAGASLWRIFPSFLLALALLFYGRDWIKKKPRTLNFSERFLLRAAIPYFLWVFLAQNLARPRHLLVLVLLALPPLAHGIFLFMDFCLAKEDRRLPTSSSPWKSIEKGPYKLFFGPSQRNLLLLKALVLLLLLLPTFVASLHLTFKQKKERSPALQALAFFRSRYPAGGFTLYAGEESRVFEYYAPQIIVRRVRNMDEVMEDPLLSQPLPNGVLITSGALKGWLGQPALAKILPSLTLVRSFRRDPFVDPYDSVLVLYRLEKHLCQLMLR